MSRSGVWLIVAGCTVVSLGLASLGPVSATAGVRTLAGFPHRVQTQLLGTSDSYFLGESDALGPGIAVVGDPSQPVDGFGAAGAVEVYAATRSRSHSQKPVATLDPPSPTDSGGFGYSVATDGSTIVVGSPNMPADGADDAGVVYVFARPAAGWQAATSPVATITAPSPTADAGFGTSVAVEGKTVVVGAPNAAWSEGQVVVFTEPNTGWSGSAPSYAVLGDPSGTNALGTSVAIDGDLIAAGAPNYDLSFDGAGAIELFVEPSDGRWASVSAPSRVLGESEPIGDQRLGASVAMHGEYVVGGAPATSGSQPGRADVFTRPAGGWTVTGEVEQSAQLSDDAATNASQFGDQVAIDGSEILVGVPNQTVAGTTNAGVVDVFTLPKSGYGNAQSPIARVSGPSPQPNALFGLSLADYGAHILVGAPAVPAGGTSMTPRGTAYLFTALPLPTLSKVSQSHSSWKRGTKLPALNPKKAVKGGTAYRFTTNQSMPVTFAFAKRSHGHYRAAHDLRVSAAQGRNVVYFDGRLAKSATLRAGTYRVVITATNPAGDHTRAVTLHFTVARAAR